jgi:hypothetical protein
MMGVALGLRDDLDRGPVGLGAHPLGRLVTARPLVRRLALALGLHALEGRGEVLLGQVGALEPHVDHLDAEGAGLDDRGVADAVHQPDAVGREHRLGAHGAEGLAHVGGQDRPEPLLGRHHAADADGAAELLDVRDPPAREGVDDEPAVVERRHLEGDGLDALDARVVVDDVLDEGDLEAEAGSSLTARTWPNWRTMAFCRSSTM